MKKWEVYELSSSGTPYSFVMTEDEIIDDFWDYWHGKMVDKYGEGYALITRENCIQDWVCLHWASELKE